MRVPGTFMAWLAGSALVVTGTSRLSPDAAERAPDTVAYALVGSACVVLLAARRWPVAAAAGVSLAQVAYVLGRYPDGPPLLTGLAAAYAVAVARPRRTAAAVAAGMAAAVAAAGAVADQGPGIVDLAFAGWVAVVVLAADVHRGRTERRAARRDRDRLEAEARDQEHHRRLAEERLRLARDLHDTVAHAMATINVQAAMAGRVVDARPDLAKAALEVVRTVSGGVLDELNALVRVLRDGADRTPAPGLADLPALVGSAEHAGVTVRLRCTVPPDAVSAPVGLSLYRIVQESLTNVSRHAGPATATVVVSHDGDGLRLSVRDTGRSTVDTTNGAGVGLIGMRERAEATGGTLTAGPRPGGGFEVAAHWPEVRPAVRPAIGPEVRPAVRPVIGPEVRQ